MQLWAWFDPLNGAHAIDGPVKRRDCSDACPLCAGDEVGLGEVETVNLIDLDGTEQQVLVDHSYRVECDDRTHHVGDVETVDLVIRLEYVHDLGNDKIR